MKKVILLSIILGSLFFACTKENDPIRELPNMDTPKWTNGEDSLYVKDSINIEWN